jgi:nitrogen fixation protein FixH
MRLFRVNDDHPLTGWHMLAIVCGFFAVIIGVNLVLAFAAAGTFPGLVVDNSYVASQKYNELLAAARRQQAAGWRYELRADGGVLQFELATAAGTPVAGLAVSALVGRPSTARDDRALDLTRGGGGRYRSIEILPPGRWEIDITGRRDGEIVFRNTHEIFVEPAEPRP